MDVARMNSRRRAGHPADGRLLRRQRPAKPSDGKHQTRAGQTLQQEDALMQQEVGRVGHRGASGCNGPNP